MLELTIRNSTAGVTTANSQYCNSCKDWPRPLPLNDCDDISYFVRFDRLAVLRWFPDSKAIHLEPLLRGKAVRVYYALPIDIITNYVELKADLLRYFQVTPDNIQKFPSSSKWGGRKLYPICHN